MSANNNEDGLPEYLEPIERSREMDQAETTDSLDTNDGPMRWTEVARVCVAYLRLPNHRNNMLATVDAASLLMKIAKRLDAADVDVTLREGFKS